MCCVVDFEVGEYDVLGCCVVLVVGWGCLVVLDEVVVVGVEC